jgi:large subunit ribosomal protein L22
MEVRATAKFIRVQPRKVRIIADQLRGQTALKSAALLRYHTSKSATLLHKVLVSAMANAEENHRISPEDLRISTIMVDEGPRLKRMRARAMGRGNRITKKTSHITVVVEEFEPEARVKPHGTKAKARRTLATPVKKKGATRGAAKPVTEAVPEVEVVEPILETETPVVEAAAEPVAEVVAVETPALEEVAAPEEAVSAEPAAEETAEPVAEKPEEGGEN